MKTTHRPAVSSAWLERSYPWLLLAAIVWLTWMLAKAFWLVLAPPTAPALTPVPLQPAPITQAMNGNALDIFAQPIPMQAQTVATPPPDIKVLGVTVASSASQSFAIINANNKTQSYRVNDLIDGSPYKLIAVSRDQIVIADGSGQTNKIKFGEPFSLDQSEAIRAKAQGLNQGLNQGQGMGQSMGQGMAGNSPAGVAPVISQSTPSAGSPVIIGQDRETPAASPSPTNDDTGAKGSPANNPNNAIGGAITGLQQNPAAYLSQMGVAATGQGYLVTDGMPAGLKSKLGLETGDKVLSVNGQSVGQNPAQDAQLLQQVQQSGQAQIQVQRGEQTVTVRQSF